jgi:pimeloyl-ACP methyl ester carboxylesterase
MGGFIAQTVAIEHASRVRSLTSIMSSTGDRSVGQPHPEALALFAAGAPRNRDEAMESARHVSRVIGSTGFKVDLDALAERAGRAFDRSFDPGGFVRQGAAVLASADRTPRLRDIRVPTLVIHGSGDTMCDVSGGRATAAAIPGAELVIIEGMGHDLPRGLWPRLADEIERTVRRGEASRGRP